MIEKSQNRSCFKFIGQTLHQNRWSDYAIWSRWLKIQKSTSSKIVQIFAEYFTSAGETNWVKMIFPKTMKSSKIFLRVQLSVPISKRGRTNLAPSPFSS